MSSPTATVKSLTPPEVADRLRTIDLRAGYIIGACKDTREMRLEAEEIKRLVDETFKGLRAWWHGDMAQSATEQSNAAPQGGLANAGDHDSGGSDDASVMGAAPASAAPSEAAAFEQPDFMTEAQKAAYWFDLYLEETAKRRKLERERNAWEAKFNAECEKHDATTMRAMIAERELAEANKRDSRNFARMVEQGLRADRAEKALRIAQSTNTPTKLMQDIQYEIRRVMMGARWERVSFSRLIERIDEALAQPASTGNVSEREQRRIDDAVDGDCA